MQLTLLVGLGGALGAMLRFIVGNFVSSHWSETFPWGTFVINVSGSLLIGLFAATTAPHGRWFAGSGWSLFLISGICGGYTTFSSFSLQTLFLMRDGEWLRAGGNIVGSVVVCIFAAWVGYQAGTAFNAAR